MNFLLHACCAPCSAPIIESLMKDGITPTIFYENSNIYPFDEYLKRKQELEAYCQKLKINFVESEYNHDAWLQYIKGLESEPERGSRCQQCFKYRMCRTAQFAADNGFSVIASSLSSSRWKSLEQIDIAGNEAVKPFETVSYLARNWRKGGLQNRRNELLKENNFYNQQYCGCEFSIR